MPAAIQKPRWSPSSQAAAGAVPWASSPVVRVMALVAMVATPSEAPTWKAAVSTPDAMPCCSCGTSDTPWTLTGMVQHCIAAPSRSSAGSRSSR